MGCRLWGCPVSDISDDLAAAIKLHCCIEGKEGRKEGGGREGGRKRNKERERENVKVSLEQQGSAGWLCCCSFQSALLLSDWVRAECQGQEGVLGKSKIV